MINYKDTTTKILFRGKRCDNDKWAQGFYVRAEYHWHEHGIHKDWIVCSASANGGWFALHNKHAVKAETVEQYTGLTDKNGKKIFEGDIVKIDRKVYEVRYMFGQFIVGMNMPVAYKRFDCEVVGNIHDNPEFLNEL